MNYNIKIPKVSSNFIKEIKLGKGPNVFFTSVFFNYWTNPAYQNYTQRPLGYITEYTKDMWNKMGVYR